MPSKFTEEDPLTNLTRWALGGYNTVHWYAKKVIPRASLPLLFS